LIPASLPECSIFKPPNKALNLLGRAASAFEPAAAIKLEQNTDDSSGFFLQGQFRGKGASVQELNIKHERDVDAQGEAPGKRAKAKVIYDITENSDWIAQLGGSFGAYIIPR
jgi:hypothetical protein